jgi:hypothetical protein
VDAQQILDEQNLDEVLPYFHLLLEHLAVYFLPVYFLRDVARRPDLVVLVDEEELKVLQKDYFQLWQQEQLVVLQEVELERYFLAGSLLLPEQ